MKSKIDNDSMKFNIFNSIDDMYKIISEPNELRNNVFLLLKLRSWLTNVCEFDPVTGQALTIGIDDIFEVIEQRITKEAFDKELKDYIYRIVIHVNTAIQSILECTREKVLREHAMIPIHAAREVDSASVQWLSLQPGRNFREKLSGKPYIKAVKRSLTIDSSENRLLKAFLIRLEELLFIRQSALNSIYEETCEDLLVSLQRWLRSDESKSIGHWGNLSPNNTLLQDKRYRKIWDSWIWIQNIDERVNKDIRRLDEDFLSFIYWRLMSLLNKTGRLRTIQQPVDIDYDNFMITPTVPIKGYLFPKIEDRITGKIRIIDFNKNFGFVTSDTGIDLFFHKNDLSYELKFDLLKEGQIVSYEIGSNQKGNCAKNIDNIRVPEIIEMQLLSDKITIMIGKICITIQIVSSKIVIFSMPESIEKMFSLDLSEISNILSEILLILNVDVTLNLKSDDSSVEIGNMEEAVIDLCSIRPRLTNSKGAQVLLPFRLLQQFWSLDQGTVVMDCGISKGICINSKIETVSMKSLFSYTSTLGDAIKSNASMFFARKINDYICANSLFYLVPDWGNDFDLECVRKSFNFYFEKSTPFPKSIAAIFAWQSSKRFELDQVGKNDFVLVLDVVEDGISITPVQAIYKNDLYDIISETNGISWERHPTFIVSNKSIYSHMVNNLSKSGCNISEELIRLFDFDGLVNEAGELSFLSHNEWYHVPNAIREILNKDMDVNAISNQCIKESIHPIIKDYPNAKVFILPLVDTLKKIELQSNFVWLGSAWSPIKGCQIFNRWQKYAGEIALWRDHLPELSIKIVRNGYYEKFYLVKDATVTPQRGSRVSIPVEESFTLPSGKMHYSFPLQQGDGNKELHFVAYLKSPKFPLKVDTICNLAMTYTYGADDPYELKFIPLDFSSSEFKSINVEWRSVNETRNIDLENMPVPVFPHEKKWSEFSKFPKGNGQDYTDLLDWIVQVMNKISQLYTFLNNDKQSERKYIEAAFNSYAWKSDKNGKKYCYISFDFGNVFFHESNYENFNMETEGISFDLEKQRDRDGYVARNITLGRTIPKSTVENLRKSIRFPLLTIWNNGHSLSESDAPDWFRNSVFWGCKCALSLIEIEGVSTPLKDELFFFLSCLHKDAPNIVANRLLKNSLDKKLLKKYNRNIAFAIGNADLIWQKELLNNIMSPMDKDGLMKSISMEMLAIVFWRSKNLIYKLNEKDLKSLCNNLYYCLEFDIYKIKSGEKVYQLTTLCKHLELLLALLRTREIEHERIKTILAPNMDLTNKFVTLIDDVSKLLLDNCVEIRSRINLQIVKPEMFRNTPDILYALRMYLTGDSGANTISISGISDDE